ncbi:MAG: type III pantothenate kinase [bacterium]
MILSIDIGNTSTVLGLFKDSKLYLKKRLNTENIINSLNFHLKKSQKSSNSFDKTLNELKEYALKRSNKICGISLASVVPHITNKLIKLLKSEFHAKVLNVDYRTKSGLVIKIDNPKELGADRIVNASFAYHCFHGACIIVDMGTATTLDCVNNRGEYIGGMILPGIEIAAKALKMFTAKLPFVSFKKPLRVIGRNTIQCISSGLYYGGLGMIQEAIKQCKKEIASDVTVILTGGLGGLFFYKLKEIKYYWQDLTLIGLNNLWEINT